MSDVPPELLETVRPLIEALGPIGRRAEAVALQQRASELFAAADEADHLAALEETYQAAMTRADDAAEHVAQLEGAVEPAVVAERQADDRWRAAAENHRQAAAAERKAQQRNASAELQTEALLRVRAAADVAERAQAALEGAQAARQAADRGLRDARGELERLEAAARAARPDEANPGPAPRSGWTTILDAARLVMTGAALTDQEALAVSGAVVMLARKCGAASHLYAEGVKHERERLAPHLPALPQGTVLAPQQQAALTGGRP